MTGFNLSAWAITHRSLVYYFMVMLVIIGVASYMKLGRNEDPTFTIKTMTVTTQWPGATHGTQARQSSTLSASDRRSGSGR